MLKPYAKKAGVGSFDTYIKKSYVNGANGRAKLDTLLNECHWDPTGD